MPQVKKDWKPTMMMMHSILHEPVHLNPRSNDTTGYVESCKALAMNNDGGRRKPCSKSVLVRPGLYQVWPGNLVKVDKVAVPEFGAQLSLHMGFKVAISGHDPHYRQNVPTY